MKTKINTINCLNITCNSECCVYFGKCGYNYVGTYTLIMPRRNIMQEFNN